jgi:N6-L-threonylcarbamoyladenine synthase
MPGGPSVETAALTGDPKRFKLPRPMLGRPEPHFSFAGLKTAVRQAAKQSLPLNDQTVADLCASFQRAVSETVADRVATAMALADPLLDRASQKRLIVAGGVAANKVLRSALARVADVHKYELHVPPMALCTDNGAMIAWAGLEHLALGHSSGLDAPVRPRWPLDPDAPPAIGAGVKA